VEALEVLTRADPACSPLVNGGWGLVEPTRLQVALLGPRGSSRARDRRRGGLTRPTSRDDDARDPPSKAARHRSAVLATTSRRSRRSRVLPTEARYRCCPASSYLACRTPACIAFQPLAHETFTTRARRGRPGGLRLSREGRGRHTHRHEAVGVVRARRTRLSSTASCSPAIPATSGRDLPAVKRRCCHSLKARARRAPPCSISSTAPPSTLPSTSTSRSLRSPRWSASSPSPRSAAGGGQRGILGFHELKQRSRLRSSTQLSRYAPPCGGMRPFLAARA
jgi:hypothetical protein